MTLKVSGSPVRLPALGLAGVLACATALSGCANGPSSNGDPGAKPLAPGQSCQSIKADLDRMVSNGVQSSVEAQSAGRKLSVNQKADADRYNGLLGQNLGARCHVA